MDCHAFVAGFWEVLLGDVVTGGCLEILFFEVCRIIIFSFYLLGKIFHLFYIISITKRNPFNIFKSLGIFLVINE